MSLKLIVSVKVDNIRYYLSSEDAKKLLKIEINDYISEKKNITIEAFKEPQMINKVDVVINYNLLRRVMMRLEESLESIKDQEIVLEQNRLKEEEKEANHKKKIKQDINNDKLAARNIKLKNDKLSIKEINHVNNVQKLVEEKIKLDKAQAEASNRIKRAYNQTLKIFECSNGIMMDGHLTDAENLEKGILYNEKQGKLDTDKMIIQDYNNVDHNISIKEAKKMVREIEDNFYQLRDKKQNLYNKIKATKNTKELLKIKF